MSEYNTTNYEKVKIQNIRKQYLDKEENKMEQLKELDNKVKMPGKIAAGILGVGGALLLGAGMSNIMVWDAMQPGLVMGIPGLIIALLSYPVYTLITNGRKKKYAIQIMKLSDELMK
jgi:hypothetical protein